jgi:mono/diheme cytochrome c family protein
MRRALLQCLAVAAAVAVAGCAAGPHTRAGGAVGPLTVRPVAWNPSQAGIGKVRAVADMGNVVAVLGDAGATVLSSGAVVATDPSVTDWVEAGTIPGADGAARWIVGIDSHGRVRHLHGLSAFEDVSARYGLDGRRVRGAAALDAGRVGFLLDGEIAVADGRRVTRYGAAPLTSIAGDHGVGVAAGNGLVVVFDAARLTSRTYALPGVTGAVVAADGRVVAITPRAVYASTAIDSLALLYDAGADTLHGLVASGTRVWFGDGEELGVVEGGRVAETTGARIALDARLVGSPSGDVWVIAGGALQRFASVEPGAAEPALAWGTRIGPVFARACASCHQPGGVSGTDLSTASAWQAERANIDDRVVVHKTMPPEGHPLSDVDREAIRAWVDAR